MEAIKTNISKILIVVGVLLLAATAIFTGVKLMNNTQQSAPEPTSSDPVIIEEEAPEDTSGNELTFSLNAAAATFAPRATATPAGTLAPEPTETSAIASPTATATPSATPKGLGGTAASASPSASPVSTTKATSSPSPTDEASLPKAGTSFPAYFGVAAGLVLLMGAIILAF